MASELKIAVIGGGAAGFFAAISAKTHNTSASVEIIEKTSKILSKVKVSGGGRCNVTNACFSPGQLSKNYPRGGKKLKKAFKEFQASDTVNWYESRGVKLKAEADGRMFPVSDNSQSIIDCLVGEAEKLGVEVRTSCAVDKLSEGFNLRINGKDESFDKVIVATGGRPKSSGFDWLRNIGVGIVEPVPSLFTFNMPGNSVKTLMGVVIPEAEVRIQGTKLSSVGPVLITHWGMSGPAILKLSAWGARELAEKGYEFKVQINWIGIKNEDEAQDSFVEVMESVRKKKMANANPYSMPNKFWTYILQKAEVNPDNMWMELPKKSKNKILNLLLNDIYEVKGKTTFKEEFVTCGGVVLGEVDFNTMESSQVPGLHFAGEVLDIDGVTGGFNFQAAWTTGYIAGKSVSS
jgi:predicted Rossmann fold flavoprotein